MVLIGGRFSTQGTLVKRTDGEASVVTNVCRTLGLTLRIWSKLQIPGSKDKREKALRDHIRMGASALVCSSRDPMMVERVMRKVRGHVWTDQSRVWK